MPVVAICSWPSHSAITLVSMPGVEEPHGSGVSQGVHGDVFAGQAGAGGGGCGEVDGEPVPDRVGGHRLTVGSREEGLSGPGCAFVEVGGE